METTGIVYSAYRHRSWWTMQAVVAGGICYDKTIASHLTCSAKLLKENNTRQMNKMGLAPYVRLSLHNDNPQDSSKNGTKLSPSWGPL